MLSLNNNLCTQLKFLAIVWSTTRFLKKKKTVMTEKIRSALFLVVFVLFCFLQNKGICIHLTKNRIHIINSTNDETEPKAKMLNSITSNRLWITMIIFGMMLSVDICSLFSYTITHTHTHTRTHTHTHTHTHTRTHTHTHLTITF